MLLSRHPYVSCSHTVRVCATLAVTRVFPANSQGRQWVQKRLCHGTVVLILFPFALLSFLLSLMPMGTVGWLHMTGHHGST